MVTETNPRYGTYLTKEVLLMRDGWKCFYCGHPFSVNMDGWNNMQLDHKDPNGGDGLDNLVISCSNCNSAKGKTVFNDENFENFRKRRSLIRSLDEKFVTERFAYISEMSGPEKKSYDEQNINDIWTGKSIKEKLMEKFKLSEESIKEKLCDGAPYYRFEVNKKPWTYTPSTFSLQPLYILYDDNEGSPIGVNIERTLEYLGYVKNFNFRAKYLKPFTCIDEGIEIIEKEISLINYLWSLYDK